MARPAAARACRARSPTRDGLAREPDVRPARAALAGARRRLRLGAGTGRTDLHASIDTVGRTADRRATSRGVRRLGRRVAGGPAGVDSTGADRRWPRAVADGSPRRCGGRARPGRPDRRAGARADHRRRRRPGRRRGAGRPAAARRRRRRRDLRGEPQHQLHQRLLHRLPVLRVRPAAPPTPTPTRCRSTQVADRARGGLGRLGATEICMQGGIDPELPGTAYFDLARAVKRRVPRDAPARLLARWRSSTAPPARAYRSGTSCSRLARPGSTRSPAPPPRSSTTRCAGC